MREEKLSDKIWSIVLIALPVLAMLLGSIPGFLKMYDGQLYRMVGCTLWNPPERNIMSNLCPAMLLIFAYTLILTVCYYRSQALGTIRGIFVLSVACFVISGMALLPNNTVKDMPFALIPGIWVIMSVVAFIRMTLEAKRFDFD